MNVRSHINIDAAISLYRRGEIPLAIPLIDSLPDNSVTLLDGGESNDMPIKSDE